jgi:hypothetical protein
MIRVNRGVSAFQQESRVGTKHRMYACVRTYGYEDTMQVRLVVERNNERDPTVIGRDMGVEIVETRVNSCYRSWFHVERARELVTGFGFTAPTTHLNLLIFFILNSLLYPLCVCGVSKS